MHADTKQLFSSLESVRGESAALALADGCLKAMFQTAFDLHHLSTVQLESLLGQVTESVVGESPDDGKEGVPIVTDGEPGPEVGEPPGGGKEDVSMLTGNEPGRKAGEPPVTWPTPKDNKADSALRRCSKKTKKRRQKEGGAANSMRLFRIQFHQHILSKNSPFGFASLLLRGAGVL
jgi:hypothetical protein